MRVAILGPGALGRALGEALRKGGAEVSTMGRTSAEGAPERAEVVLVTVKSGDTEAALERLLPRLSDDAAVVSLQNGLGNVEKIAEKVGAARTFGGSTTHAARRLPDGQVLHTANGETRIAPFERRSLERARQIAQGLTEHGVMTACEDDLGRLLWRKLVVSCAVNAVSALLGCENGGLLRSEAARRLVREAAREVAETAEKFGVKLERDPGAWALEVAERTAQNRSSMLQDLDAGRPTEVAHMNGAAVERASRVGLELPINRTLLALVRAREELAQTQAPAGPRGPAGARSQPEDSRTR